MSFSSIIKTVGQDAVIAWNDFKAGVHYVAVETEKVAAIAEALDPGLQVQLQALLKAGEDGALVLAGVATGGTSNYIVDGADEIEQLLASFLQSKLGGNAKGVSTALVDTLNQGVHAFTAALPVAAAKIAAAVAAEVPGASSQAVGAAVLKATTPPSSGVMAVSPPATPPS